jgi:hypothetical protein
VSYPLGSQHDQPPHQDINDISTVEVSEQPHANVKTSSRTRWRRIRTGGTPSKKQAEALSPSI